MDHAVIMAGGGGTRLWPMSRRDRPKQFLPLIEGRTLLSLALERVSGLFEPERTWVITSNELVERIRSAAPHLPPENVLGEPAIRDTANAIGLACLLLRGRDADARMAVFTADHVIRPQDRFAAAVRDALGLIGRHPQQLLTFGVTPTHPHTCYGYVQAGAPADGGCFRAKRFVEKPDQATACRYLADGHYYWNSGMFLWRADTAVELLGRHRPEHAARLAEAADAWSAGDTAAVARIYDRLPRISIDYALMEPAADDGDVLVRPLDCQWLDVGSWPVLDEVNANDESGNVCTGRVVTLDSSGNVLVSDAPEHLLAAVGVEGLVVVHTADATLIVPKSRAQEIKKLLELVERRFGRAYE